MESINKLIAQANKLYALKSYTEASDLYAHATEDLTNLNGEGSPKNAMILFLYGRTLLKIALQKSEVLGSGNEVEPQNGEASEADQAVPIDARFSFQGDGDDEDFEDVDDAAAEQHDPNESEAEDHFQDAWEVLDVARVSFKKQLESKDDFADKSEVKKMLADTYDALGEIALENENFDQAVADLKTALELKMGVYEESSSQCSGAHYMLALALEYCTSPASREAAAKEIEASIGSFDLRLLKLDETSKEAADEREMLGELKTKLAELRAPVEIPKKEDIADIFGKEGTALKNTLVQAMQSSNDLSGLVRKKDKKRNLPPTAPDTSTEAAAGTAVKKTKVEAPE